MVVVHPHAEAIADNFDGILLDAYGVFWGGNSIGLLPGSKEAMQKLVAKGKTVGILSNSSQLAAKEIDKLKAHGVTCGIHFHFLITSGEVAKDIFSADALPFPTSKKKFWLSSALHPRFGAPHSLFYGSPFTEAASLHEADFIYVSIPHINGEDQTEASIFREEVFTFKNTGLPMVCANPDHFAHEGAPPRAVVRQGSIAALYEEMNGQVFYIGKPSSIMYETAMKQFAMHNVSDKTRVLMVGDTPETDIRGANRFGMPSALLTQTGIFADRILRRTMQSVLNELPSEDVPKFLLERLSHGI